jgi:hypothetical protein
MNLSEAFKASADRAKRLDQQAQQAMPVIHNGVRHDARHGPLARALIIRDELDHPDAHWVRETLDHH